MHIRKKDFNPRSHKGSDFIVFEPCVAGLRFQSTLPQGERPKDKIGKFAFNKISIHAPTRGATSASKSEDSRARNFNPRSHKGSDRCQLINSFEYDEFQSTLPQGERQAENVSVSWPYDFNPRSHKGSDGLFRPVNSVPWEFQSTLPQGERRDIADGECGGGGISIHAPTRGATVFPLDPSHLDFQFQSTLPQGERLFSLDSVDIKQ